MLVQKFADKIKSESVRLGVLPSESLVAESLVNLAFSVDRLFDSKSMGNLTECDVPIECLFAEVILLVWGKNHNADRVYDSVELLNHYVAKKGSTGACLSLNFFIIRKIQSYQLNTSVGVTRAIDSVIGVNVRLVSWYKILVLFFARDLFLELRQHGRELVKYFGAFEVF